MKCKDCIYFKRCVVLGVALDMKHDKEADKNCRHFKNKADFVEVVRCKDCKHKEKLTNKWCKFWFKFCAYDNNFCSHGERSEKE
jgi:hypothetical protein